MARAHFTLVVVATLDGYIARAPDHPPQTWASAAEQAVFFAAVEQADWTVMGRHTHEAADKPNRRRIIFSSRAGRGDWRRPTQLWVDPRDVTARGLAALVEGVHPLHRGLILGGTGVHHWFHAQGAIDEISLTIEPLRFGSGLPMFRGFGGQDPLRVCRALGYELEREERLNVEGTRLLTLRPTSRR